MSNSLHPRLTVEQCKRNSNWPGRCDLNLIPIPTAIFGALFMLLTGLHIFLAIKYRKCGGIYWSLIIASFFSAVGYWIKFGVGGPNPNGLGQLATAYVLMFLPVFWINGYIYYCLRHLYLTYIPPRTVIKSSTSLFWSLMGFDISIWMTQIAALVFLFSYGIYVNGGMMFVCTILFFSSFLSQLCMYITTVVFLTIFLRSANKKRKMGALLTQQFDLASRGSIGADYKPTVITLYIATCLLIIRALYYIANTCTPEDGFKTHGDYAIWHPATGTDKYGHWEHYNGSWGFKFHDPSQLGFDAAPVFLALLVLSWPKGYAPRVLHRAEKKRGDRDVEDGRQRVWPRENVGLELDLQPVRTIEGRGVEQPVYEANREVTADGRAPVKL